MMEVINKASETFFSFDGRNGLCTITFQPKGMYAYLSSEAVREFSLKPQQRIHLVCDLDRIYMYFNGDKDGFSLNKIKGQNGLRFKTKTLIKVLVNKFPTKKIQGGKFKLRSISTKINGNDAIEIMLYKRL